MYSVSGYSTYGVVVESVKVTLLPYVPVRSGSLEPIDCLKATSTTSPETGPDQAAFDSSTRSGCARLKAPLTRWPGSLVVRVASPAVEMTVAVVAAVYSYATPGVKAPNVAGAPSVSDRVAGTVPPTDVSALASAWERRCVSHWSGVVA